jgi:glycosyltransferase involved in cell wall biosynthesis
MSKAFTDNPLRIATPPEASRVLASGTGTDPVDVEIVLPVYNEERALPASVPLLHAFLNAEAAFSWRLTIADNASTDDTSAIGRRLAQSLPGVSYLRLEQKGRGRALKAAWGAGNARVLAYMDVDLATGLQALTPLVTPLLARDSELAIGSRLVSGARVQRSFRRALISLSYNLILRTALRALFSDAQCGFKAIRADVAAALLPEISDNDWFFDTELLVTAQRRGLRIHEVAVDWVEDPDSRVRVVPTALADLRGVLRLLRGGRGARQRARPQAHSPSFP